MNYEPITIQRLDDFGAILREYESLKAQKYKLEKQLGLSGVDLLKGYHLEWANNKLILTILNEVKDAD